MLIWSRNGIFLLDSQSGNIKGFSEPSGGAILLEFRLIKSLNNFIKRFYQLNVQTHLFSSLTLNILKSIYLKKLFLICKQSTIKRKLSLGSVNKMKEIIFELKKMKVIIRNPLQINQGKLKNLKLMIISLT